MRFPRPRRKGGLNLTGSFVNLVKDAISYGNEIGDPHAGLNLSPRALMMRLKVLRRDEKRKQIQMAESFLVANSQDKKVWEEFCRI